MTLSFDLIFLFYKYGSWQHQSKHNHYKHCPLEFYKFYYVVDVIHVLDMFSINIFLHKQFDKRYMCM